MTRFLKTALVAAAVLTGAASAHAGSMSGNPYLAVHGINGVAYGK